MKLKNMLILIFMMLTLIPIVIIAILLYISGYDLSKESYMRNLSESIAVQSDYISQTIENNMIADYRFTRENSLLVKEVTNSSDVHKGDLHTALQRYLSDSEDKITVCLLLDKDNAPLYTIGEKATLDTVSTQLPPLSETNSQRIMEFNLGETVDSLGIVTPILDANGTYLGSLVSIYDETYLFKIISSYHKIANTSTYICKENGEIINFRQLSDGVQNTAIEESLKKLSFTTEGPINMKAQKVPVAGYYKSIEKSPWFLVGFVDNKLVYSFTNQYVFAYFLIILCVLIADIILAFYFSQKVVQPIRNLITVMEGYPNNLSTYELEYHEHGGYIETKYLRTKFLDLMKRILLVQHNFEGVYQLYQSSSMSDTNIDINTIEQTINSNKEIFKQLMNELEIPTTACIVERFTNCFCKEDQLILMNMFEDMRDRHLSIPCEVEVYTPHLNVRWFHILVVPMYENDSLSHLFIQLRDITNFKKQELKSTEEARRDALTGLHNRIGFTEYVSQSLETGDPSATHGLLFLDMDYFKMVNDNFGHGEGDSLLRSVGRTLLDIIGPSDIASRFGGDEFAVYLPNTTPEIIAQVKESICQKLIYPYTTEKINFTVTASIGVSLWTIASPYTLEELLQQADVAMYQAKKRIKVSK